MWMMPLHLHVNQISDYDGMILIYPPETLIPGRIAQSVTCLATDASLTADPGVASSIPVPYFSGD